MNVHATSCTCAAHPLPPSMRVRDALDLYLAENGFTKEGYESPKTTGSLLGLEFSVPNPPPHQRAVRLHDLHHVATGFGTDHAGEAEISVWQARRGLLAAGMYVTSIVLFNVAVGLVLAPRRTLRALHEATSGVSLFGTSVAYESLLELTLGELREMLLIPHRGLAQLPRGRHAHAPAVSAT